MNTNLTADWRTQAACTTSPDTMFPASGNTKGLAAARGICAGCPVTVACLTATMRIEGTGSAGKTNRHGIAAGTTPGQRAALHKHITDTGQPLDEAVAKVVGRLFEPRRSLRDLFEENVRSVGGGHVIWDSSLKQIKTNGRSGPNLLPRPAAFLLGYGRPFEGALKVECGLPDCIAWQHLTDTRMRKGTVRRLPSASSRDQLRAVG